MSIPLLAIIDETCDLLPTYRIWQKWWNVTPETMLCNMGYPGGLISKESACSAGDPGSIPALGRPPGEGNGNPFQYSCLGNLKERGQRTEEPGRLQSMWLQESDTTYQLNHHISIRLHVTKLDRKAIPLALTKQNVSWTAYGEEHVAGN